MKPIIEVKNVSYSYPKINKKIINNVNIDIYAKQFISIIGPNGSGKTTLVKLLNGLLLPTEGVVIVDNIITDGAGEQIWEIRKRVGIVFQNPDNQIVANTVEDDVAFGLENYGVNSEEIRARVDQALKDVDLLSEQMKEPRYLSGGQKQKVAIAGILALKPKVIILDEATTMLDPKGKKEILMLCKRLCDNEGITILHVTNNMQEVLSSDRIIVINDGEIILDDIPLNIFNKSDVLMSMGLELPIIVDLANRLRDKGHSITENVILEEELIKNLWTLI